MLVLDSTTKKNPNATWWIKGDGCDIVPGIYESVNIVLSGDVNLNDGELQKAYQQYRKQLEFISGIGLNTRQTKELIVQDLKVLCDWLVSDQDFAIASVSIEMCTFSV